MALRGIQEYIARDANSVARVEPKKESSNTIVIIYIGLCVSSYYLMILSDCHLPFFLFTNSTYGLRTCIERSSSGNIQVTYYCPGNNVSEHAQIYVNNFIAVLVTKHVEYTILFWLLKALYEL